jgi:homoserine O-acetyltransferase
VTSVTKGSVGIVETKYFNYTGKIRLECGKELGPLTVAYETYGALNADKSNVVFVCHALSGSAHAAGYHTEQDKDPGWWDDMIGPGKAFDTNRYFVVCSNFIASCYGTTGPQTVNPETGKPYGLTFPMITVTDMVRVQKMLLDDLGMSSLLTVTGGSMGGMQALEWPILFPDMVRSSIVIAATSKLSPQAIAFNAIGREAILSDPDWKNGDYYDTGEPAKGLSIARMIGHITYLSDESMHRKFGRRLQDKEVYSYDFGTDFAVESYLRYKGESFVKRFDANSYLYISRAMDYFDIAEQYGDGSLRKALEGATAKFLVLSFRSDWLFPTYQSLEIVKALLDNDKEVSFCEIESYYGHDAFLLEFEQESKIISGFLDSLVRQRR